jgi:hypothetical protein
MGGIKRGAEVQVGPPNPKAKAEDGTEIVLGDEQLVMVRAAEADIGRRRPGFPGG